MSVLRLSQLTAVRTASTSSEGERRSQLMEPSRGMQIPSSNGSSTSNMFSENRNLSDVQNHIRVTADAMVNRIRQLEQDLLERAESMFQENGAPSPQVSICPSDTSSDVTSETDSAISSPNQADSVYVKSTQFALSFPEDSNLSNGQTTPKESNGPLVQFRVDMGSMVYVNNTLSLGTLSAKQNKGQRLRWAAEVKDDESELVTLVGKVNPKRDDDAAKPNITDAVAINSSEDVVLVLVDQANKCLKAFHGENYDERYSQVNFQGEPWSVARLKDTKVVVTVPSKKQLAVCKLYMKLYKSSKISVRKQYMGVTALDSNTLIVTAFWPYSCMDIIDLRGRILLSLNCEPENPNPIFFKQPFFVCTSADKSKILTTDNGGKKNQVVWCFSTQGELLWTYQPKNGDLTGIVCLPSGHVLVADRQDNTVCVLTGDGMDCQATLLDRRHVEEPLAMHYSSQGLLFISQADGQIKYFRVSNFPNAVGNLTPTQESI